MQTVHPTFIRKSILAGGLAACLLSAVPASGQAPASRPGAPSDAPWMELVRRGGGFALEVHGRPHTWGVLLELPPSEVPAASLRALRAQDPFVVSVLRLDDAGAASVDVPAAGLRHLSGLSLVGVGRSTSGLATLGTPAGGFRRAFDRSELKRPPRIDSVSTTSLTPGKLVTFHGFFPGEAEEYCVLGAGDPPVLLRARSKTSATLTAEVTFVIGGAEDQPVMMARGNGEDFDVPDLPLFDFQSAWAWSSEALDPGSIAFTGTLQVPSGPGGVVSRPGSAMTGDRPSYPGLDRALPNTRKRVDLLLVQEGGELVLSGTDLTIPAGASISMQTDLRHPGGGLDFHTEALVPSESAELADLLDALAHVYNAGLARKGISACAASVDGELRIACSSGPLTGHGVVRVTWLTGN